MSKIRYYRKVEEAKYINVGLLKLWVHICLLKLLKLRLLCCLQFLLWNNICAEI